MRRAVPLFAFLCLTACEKPGPPPQSPAARDAAPSSLPLNDENFQQLSQRVTKLEADAQVRQLVEDSDQIAYLTPEDKTWSSLKTVIGTIAVSLQNVTDYANGSEITLQFGNPTAARLSNISMTVEWGKLDAKGNFDGDPLTKDVSLTDELPPGSWHNVSVELRDIPPKNLGYVRIKNFTLKSISLARAVPVSPSGE